jgi:hypothetical protein
MRILQGREIIMDKYGKTVLARANSQKPHV